MTITDLGYANRQLDLTRKELLAAKKEIKELNDLLKFQRDLIGKDNEAIRFREMLIEAYESGLNDLKYNYLFKHLKLEDFQLLQVKIEDLKR